MNLLTIIETNYERLFQSHTHFCTLSLLVTAVTANPVFVETVNLTFINLEVTFVKALKFTRTPFAFVGANLNTVSKTLVRIIRSNSALAAGILEICYTAACLANKLTVGILADVLVVSVYGVDRYGRIPKSLFSSSLLILTFVLRIKKF